MAFTGRHTQTDYSIDGRTVEKNDPGLADAFRNGRLTSATRIDLFGRIFVIENLPPSLIVWPPIVLAFVWVYMPGVLWRPARHVGARFVLAAVPVFGLLLAA